MAMRAKYELGGARGFRYADVPAELERTLAAWIAGSPPEDAEPLGGAVHRHGAFAVKAFGPGRGLADRLRPSAAVRSADLATGLGPVATPRPIVALERRVGSRLEASWLVTDHVDGRFLHEAWDEPRAREAFPHFMAAMHRVGAYHGDLHVKNVLWDGERWFLIDLEGLRHRLRTLRRRRLVLDQWARLVCSMPNKRGIAEAFRSYLDEARPGWARADDWERVQARALELAPAWSPLRPGARA